MGYNPGLKKRLIQGASGICPSVPKAKASPKPVINMMSHLSNPLIRQRFAVAVASVLTLGTVTAVAVDPLVEVIQPEIAVVAEPMAITWNTGLAENQRFLQPEKVRRGDNLASVLGRMGAVDGQLLRFVASDHTAKKLLQLKTGRTLLAEIDGSGRVQRLSYRLGGLEDDSASTTIQVGSRIVITRTGDSLLAQETTATIERSVETRVVEVRSTLFAATEAAGMPDGVVGQIADIFGDNVDFQREVRRGDKLRVVYETLREAGSFDAPVAGRILALQMTVGGKRLDAVWVDNTILGGGTGGRYLTFDGKAVKQGFLRNPLEFSRTTSGFTESRLHPVFKDWRAHKGVDFSAPAGTRIRASGDGIVDFIGTQRGYGNVVVLKHNQTHTTLYAHMQDFAEGLKLGARVRQGDVIGFVGQTGWATGPHLHYEFRVNNEPVDPLGVELPSNVAIDATSKRKAQELAGTYRAQFVRLEDWRQARFE
jgi:murein DD-endopeptidase MepM/ murein hydrolase activator NlpD